MRKHGGQTIFHVDPVPRVSHRHLPHRLCKVIGTWAVEGRFVGGAKELPVRGTVTFRWLVKDALVVARTRTSVAPASTAVLGADDTQNSFVMLYSDIRFVPPGRNRQMAGVRWWTFI